MYLRGNQEIKCAILSVMELILHIDILLHLLPCSDINIVHNFIWCSGAKFWHINLFYNYLLYIGLGSFHLFF